MATTEVPDTAEVCTNEVCARMSAAQLLGPLRPSASICVHGHRFTLDELFPPTGAASERSRGDG